MQRGRETNNRKKNNQHITLFLVLIQIVFVMFEQCGETNRHQTVYARQIGRSNDITDGAFERASHQFQARASTFISDSIALNFDAMERYFYWHGIYIIFFYLFFFLLAPFCVKDSFSMTNPERHNVLIL